MHYFYTTISTSPLIGEEKHELNSTTDIGEWQDRKWETNTAQVDEGNMKASAVLPGLLFQ
jgi:hypothetical protein